ncbi:MAG: phenylphosphate carboxylase subunit delta [Piscirickettsiaceae bacterium CG_4_9_14_3_um_filter_43_564]|nr:phenylphosphate carboxylase subunit delta [Thiomicrospira sp.]OIP95545.1 MAG: phenylphosphate carboxylase subunit delta [Thiomicrospira sp. CG2_30_44_34]PIQ03729.1 MAG: phenylphosphate carboxylase subunit delta [Piscirickettsiaceae bacterium CG18_big_fil_WC_8_21_14_2_50_44_103]PIU39069.1 MAG: phenylphosphate carboxylase subunit delta [Piscirickettsiaceae bacterium CG07_land_8_20_14_0_80_44_28]PIW57032.1 MAG: phenylphosphate carboxylase subunit delta [Piscirickettsiaceae bacterium CG12_big_fi
MSFETEITQKASLIKLLLLDVDGVLTENQLFYGDNGQEYKAFFTRDGHGMVMLQKSGIDIGIITGRKSPLTEKRMQDLKVKHLYQGVPDKLPTFLALAEKLNLEMQQIAYVGDDILDLPILSRVGLSACPKDSDIEIIPRVDYVSRFSGGRGCVRDICELILKSQNLWQAHLDFYLR